MIRRHVVLLRAVNVGDTCKLPMSQRVAFCETLGFDDVRTYIARGCAVFTSTLKAAAVKQQLER